MNLSTQGIYSSLLIPMTDRSAKPAPQVEVLPAEAEQAPIMANLLQLYAHDFSEFLDVEIGVDGKFTYNPLPLYWSEASRHPFIIRVDNKLAGFVLIKKGSEVSGNENVWDLAEFFILRGFRRRGIGTLAAHQLWRQFPGSWEVRVMQLNVAAQRFWTRVISGFVGEALHSVPFEKDGEKWMLFSFDSNSGT
jgi:predicted acetyltransferase